MTYEESILSPGERVLDTFRAHAIPGIGVHWLLLGAAGAAAAAGVLAGAAGVGGIIAFAFLVAWGVKFLSWRNSVLVVTNKRVINGSGILAKQTRDSALEKITDLELSQSLPGRILDYGTLSILTASDKADDVFHGLGRPKTAKSTLLQAKAAMEARRTGGSDEGDIAAIDRLSRRGLLSDDDAKALLAKLSQTLNRDEGV